MNNYKEQYPKIYLYKRIVQAKLFIDEHYAGNIDLSNIADEAFFSKYHFIRLFKSTYGKTPYQYLTSVRIDQAKQMLKTGEMVSTICNVLGFESLGSFSRLFKRVVGVSPSIYFEQQQLLMKEQQSKPAQFVPNCFAEFYGW